MMKKDSEISGLKAFFHSNAQTYGVEMAFLFGSTANGRTKEESDIDVAVFFSESLNEESQFQKITDLTMVLGELMKRNIDVIVIDEELSKPMLHYNAIVHGIPLYMKDFTRYVDLRMQAIARMEDFSIFGLKWQAEVLKKRLEVLNNV